MSGKTLLITGATGVVGSALVPLFLKEEGTRLILLIRARSEEHLPERVRNLFEYWGPEVEQPGAAERIEALRGDVTEPQLGLDSETHDALASRLTHIVHCAASVKMDLHLEAARKIAVGAARHIAELAEACLQNERFAKLDYVSTLGVAGRMRGLIAERPLAEEREFHNTYESTKAEAEYFVLQKMRRGYRRPSIGPAW